MKKLVVLLRIIGSVQLILGVGLLLAPDELTKAMGLSTAPADANYLLGMLAARFLAYGIGMFVVARDPIVNVFWIRNMLFIQVIDLAVGLFYTLNGTLGLSVSAFPMFNAAVFIVLLSVWMPRNQESEK